MFRGAVLVLTLGKKSSISATETRNKTENGLHNNAARAMGASPPKKSIRWLFVVVADRARGEHRHSRCEWHSCSVSNGFKGFDSLPQCQMCFHIISDLFGLWLSLGGKNRTGFKGSVSALSVSLQLMIHVQQHLGGHCFLLYSFQKADNLKPVN